MLSRQIHPVLVESKREIKVALPRPDLCIYDVHEWAGWFWIGRIGCGRVRTCAGNTAIHRADDTRKRSRSGRECSFSLPQLLGCKLYCAVP